MTENPHTATPAEVYVLTEEHPTGTTVLRVTTTLHDAQDLDDLLDGTPTHPWAPVANSDDTAWTTRFVDNYTGTTFRIRRMPLRGTTPTGPGSLVTPTHMLDLIDNRLAELPEAYTPARHGAARALADLRASLLALIPTANPELIEAGYSVPAEDILTILNHTTTDADELAHTEDTGGEAAATPPRPAATGPDLDDPNVVAVLRLPIAVSHLLPISDLLERIYGPGLMTPSPGQFFVVRRPDTTHQPTTSTGETTHA